MEVEVIETSETQLSNQIPSNQIPSTPVNTDEDSDEDSEEDSDEDSEEDSDEEKVAVLDLSDQDDEEDQDQDDEEDQDQDQHQDQHQDQDQFDEDEDQIDTNQYSSSKVRIKEFIRDKLKTDFYDGMREHIKAFTGVPTPEIAQQIVATVTDIETAGIPLSHKLQVKKEEFGFRDFLKRRYIFLIKQMVRANSSDTILPKDIILSNPEIREIKRDIEQSQSRLYDLFCLEQDLILLQLCHPGIDFSEKTDAERVDLAMRERLRIERLFQSIRETGCSIQSARKYRPTSGIFKS